MTICVCFTAVLRYVFESDAFCESMRVGDEHKIAPPPQSMYPHTVITYSGTDGNKVAQL